MSPEEQITVDKEIADEIWTLISEVEGCKGDASGLTELASNCHLLCIRTTNENLERARELIAEAQKKPTDLSALMDGAHKQLMEAWPTYNKAYEKAVQKLR